MSRRDSLAYKTIEMNTSEIDRASEKNSLLASFESLSQEKSHLQKTLELLRSELEDAEVMENSEKIKSLTEKISEVRQKLIAGSEQIIQTLNRIDTVYADEGFETTSAVRSSFENTKKTASFLKDSLVFEEQTHRIRSALSAPSRLQRNYRVSPSGALLPSQTSDRAFGIESGDATWNEMMKKAQEKTRKGFPEEIKTAKAANDDLEELPESAITPIIDDELEELPDDAITPIYEDARNPVTKNNEIIEKVKQNLRSKNDPDTELTAPQEALSKEVNEERYDQKHFEDLAMDLDTAREAVESGSITSFEELHAYLQSHGLRNRMNQLLPQQTHEAPLEKLMGKRTFGLFGKPKFDKATVSTYLQRLSGDAAYRSSGII